MGNRFDNLNMTDDYSVLSRDTQKNKKSDVSEDLKRLRKMRKKQVSMTLKESNVDKLDRICKESGIGSRSELVDYIIEQFEV